MSSIYMTSVGVRNNDILQGCDKHSENTIIQVRTINPNGIVYAPVREYISEPYLSDLTIRDGLNNYPFFKDLTFEQRKAWIHQNAVEKYVFLNQVPGVYVKFINLNLNEIKGKNKYPLLTDEQIKVFMGPNPNEADGYWPLDLVYATLRKPGKTQTGP